MLFNRFKDYLNKQFKAIPESKEAADFREELLGNLMSNAMDLKETKSYSEDEIYDMCIQRQGDISDRLRKLSTNPLNVIRDKRNLRDMLFALTLALVSVIVFIAVSFATKRWGLVAVIVFPSSAAIIYFYATAKIIAHNTAVNSHLTTGLVLSSYVVIITLAAYFVLSFATPVGFRKSWVLFTFIPFLVCCASAFSTVFFRKKRIPVVTIIFGLSSLSVAAFLLVAVITGIWHPTWLIVLGGPVAALMTGIIYLTNKIEKQ